MIIANATVSITQNEVNLGLVLLVAILGVLAWIGRQQIKWMNRIEDKVNQHTIDLAVIKTTEQLHTDLNEIVKRAIRDSNNPAIGSVTP